MINELRIYRCLPGHLPAVLHRFETRTLDVWQRFGIRQAGFWTTLVGPSHLDLTYMLAWDSMADRESRWTTFTTSAEWRAALAEYAGEEPVLSNINNSFLQPASFSAAGSRKGPSMFEMRTYRCLPGRLPALLQRFEHVTLPLWEKHGIRQAGFWTTLVGPSHLELIYMLEWSSMAERETKWNAFQADPDWKVALAKSEEDGRILSNVENRFLQPTSFSSVQ